MRILKLVIWDLDETITTGVLEEGDHEIDPVATHLMGRLRERGTLQALATHNQLVEVQAAIEKFGWSGLFVQTEADLGPKVKMVRRILDGLSLSPLDAAFVDADTFERDSIAFQVPGISTWSLADLESYLQDDHGLTTDEGSRRSEMYINEQTRQRDEAAPGDYSAFLRSCDIRLNIRPYSARDADRVHELLARTHRMNLGALPLDEAIRRLESAEDGSVLIAEARDRYGDLGRCGILHMRRHGTAKALVESLAISCQTSARGLSLAMLVGLLRYPGVGSPQFECRYVSNGSNRPLRMLLMAAGFHTTARFRSADAERGSIGTIREPQLGPGHLFIVECFGTTTNARSSNTPAGPRHTDEHGS